MPAVYERFFPKSFWNSSVEETKATCGQCIEAPKKYDHDLKCCTFWPVIPNYIVGAILQSKDEKYKEAQEIILKHIQQHRWNLPIGLIAPSDYQVDFKKKKTEIFGRDEKFLCPYYSKSGNNCSLWLYRGSVCTSFFCHSSYKKKGQNFWHKYENYFSYLEMGISQEILVYKDYSPRDVSDQVDMLMLEKKIKLTDEKYKKIWKHNFGREREFYIEAAQFADAMPKSQVNEILGEIGEAIRDEMVFALNAIR
jgi:Fe-S-cluster containining protein